MQEDYATEPGSRAEDKPYQAWVETFDALSPDDRRRIGERIAAMPEPPRFSVVMPVYNSPEVFLRQALESVLAQLYPHWELCIADDCSSEPHVQQVLQEFAARDARVRWLRRAENGHIVAASNSALTLATGDFIALLDHDDELPPHALYMVAEEILAHPDAGVLYSDEDKMDEAGRRFNPYFKPDWNPDQFLAQNCISHLGVYRHALVREVGGFRPGFEGSQDYDLALRCTERLRPAQIRHIPHVLYHWRAIEASAARGAGLAKPYAFVAAERALTEHLARQRIPAMVRDTGLPGLYRVLHRMPSRPPLVSIVIPFRDEARSLASCVGSIIVRSIYKHVELLLVDCGSQQPEIGAFLSSLTAYKCVRSLRWDGEMVWPTLANMAAKACRGQLICFLHSDTELLAKDGISELVSQAMRPEVGAVGARLHYPNKTLQHCGITLSPTVIARHMYRGMSVNTMGYYGQAWMVRGVAAVSGACLMLRRELLDEVGPFDEELAGAYADVDLCLRLLARGYRNIFTPYAQFLHHEQHDGCYDPGAHPREASLMRQRWAETLARDPHASVNFCDDSERLILACPPPRAVPWRDASFASLPPPPPCAPREPLEPTDLSWL